MTDDQAKQAALRNLMLRLLILSNEAPLVDHDAFSRADRVDEHIARMLFARRLFYGRTDAPAEQRREFRRADVRAAVKARQLKRWRDTA